MKTWHVVAGAIVPLALCICTAHADAQQPKVIDVKVGTVADLDGDGRAIDPSGFARGPAPVQPPKDRPAAPTKPGAGEECKNEDRRADDCSR
jgi:hypothetical protein